MASEERYDSTARTWGEDRVICRLRVFKSIQVNFRPTKYHILSLIHMLLLLLLLLLLFSQALLDHCIKTRRDELEKELAEAENFLEKIRAKKQRELEEWRTQHELMRDHQLSVIMSPLPDKPKKPRRLSEPKTQYRPRLKSAWDVNSALLNDLGIEDLEEETPATQRYDQQS